MTDFSVANNSSFGVGQPKKKLNHCSLRHENAIVDVERSRRRDVMLRKEFTPVTLLRIRCVASDERERERGL